MSDRTIFSFLGYLLALSAGMLIPEKQHLVVIGFTALLTFSAVMLAIVGLAMERYEQLRDSAERDETSRIKADLDDTIEVLPEKLVTRHTTEKTNPPPTGTGTEQLEFEKVTAQKMEAIRQKSNDRQEQVFEINN